MEKSNPICFIGSSVTYGYATGGRSFVDIIEEKTKIPCHKFAVSGTTITDIDENSYYHRLITQVDTKIPYQCFVIQLSTNDTTRHLPLGEFRKHDKNTIIGALNLMVEYIQEHWKDVPIILVSNPPFDSHEYACFVFAAYMHCLKHYQKVDIMNFFSFYDPIAFKPDEMMVDDVHPNEKGYEYMARTLYHKIAYNCYLPTDQWDD